jgi:tetratricopeptide (TPR) repeat protein
MCSAVGHLHLCQGDLNQAIPILETGLGLCQSGNILRLFPDLAAQRALDLARTHQERGHEAWILPLLGDIAAHCIPPEVMHAETYYRQALSLAEELGMRPLLAHCHRGLGTLYVTTGQREQACAELSTAIALYRAMDMTFWLPQTEATLAQGNAG